jgi:hypothetical protein
VAAERREIEEILQDLEAARELWLAKAVKARNAGAHRRALRWAERCTKLSHTLRVEAGELPAPPSTRFQPRQQSR